ncbi:aspartyl-phosphate phosphatase Spo0E family protein [Bacillus haynesii]|uniref:Aspartyl-phosphate phosphatase Spo0E family protein n=1 Tax=Bacillus haynesii TaxID=1925021 RepID=A0AA90J482_9BACI|nr:aspartyl-phosphate phosphatase Spo0E family protein [Bacillus haynesii]EWH21474.1 aspartyl-phosphate phosphatase [Bacillus haynesii]MCI4130062.1 aspartyl-phosphate phosphatase Spo0E family protein [Bacillus haynesii]MCY7754234.1 aspartyl-phosphate phosphatase Spo0E family protein [Bacillus haynesii]MCY7770684.1 aspartyl-phosphate phosphatase Spo0E family protein [Bacillus haynesii]MCY7791381.1 aspartyl-phosphate phosphatase Spo0E family protein [Bacillus haynesii]
MQRYVEKEALLVSISKKRQMMVEAAEIYGYTGDETIRRSQELDQLIYEYQKLSMNENAPDNLLQDLLGCIDCLPVEKYTA